MVDADCLIAGVLISQGATSRLLDRWEAGDFELVVCPQLVYEVRKALLSPRIADRYEVSAADAEAFALKLEEEGLLVAVFLSCWASSYGSRSRRNGKGMANRRITA